MGIHIPISYVNKDWEKKLKNSHDYTDIQKEQILRHAHRTVVITNVMTAILVFLLLIGSASIGFWPTSIGLLILSVVFWLIISAITDNNPGNSDGGKFAETKRNGDTKVPNQCSKCGAKLTVLNTRCPSCGIDVNRRNISK